MDKIITDGVKRAAFRTATSYLARSTELGNKRAIELLTSEALADFIPAQRSLAMLFLQKRDREAAFAVFRHLSDLDDHVGHLRIACSYIESKENLVEARKLLERAVLSGSPAAKFYLGKMLIDGIGGEAEPDRGKAFLNEVEGSVFEDK